MATTSKTTRPATMTELDSPSAKKVKAAIDFVSLVEENGIKLQPKGREWVGLCPFHDEKTPSFSVNPAKQVYHCFGCDAGGDVYNFIRTINKCTFEQAFALLSERAGARTTNVVTWPECWVSI